MKVLIAFALVAACVAVPVQKEKDWEAMNTIANMMHTDAAKVVDAARTVAYNGTPELINELSVAFQENLRRIHNGITTAQMFINQHTMDNTVAAEFSRRLRYELSLLRITVLEILDGRAAEDVYNKVESILSFESTLNLLWEFFDVYNGYTK